MPLLRALLPDLDRLGLGQLVLIRRSGKVGVLFLFFLKSRSRAPATWFLAVFGRWRGPISGRPASPGRWKRRVHRRRRRQQKRGDRATVGDPSRCTRLPGTGSSQRERPSTMSMQWSTAPSVWCMPSPKNSRPLEIAGELTTGSFSVGVVLLQTTRGFAPRLCGQRVHARDVERPQAGDVKPVAARHRRRNEALGALE